MPYQFSANEVDVLQHVVDELIPLASWVREKKFVPTGEYPWRDGGERLCAKSLKVVEFIQGLFAATPREAAQVDMITELTASPLKRCPIAQVDQWRSERQFSPPAFGLVASKNVLTVNGQPTTREDIYRTYLPLILVAVASAKAAAGFSWSQFVGNLVNDRAEVWTQGALPSSSFMSQVAKDALRAMMSMENSIPKPLRDAVLIELGENRRVGNMYGPPDAKSDVHQLRERYEDVLANIRGLPPEHVTVIHPPVGSPPITSPDLV